MREGFSEKISGQNCERHLWGVSEGNFKKSFCRYSCKNCRHDLRGINEENPKGLYRGIPQNPSKNTVGGIFRRTSCTISKWIYGKNP